jgi:hypothetical protein
VMRESYHCWKPDLAFQSTDCASERLEDSGVSTESPKAGSEAGATDRGDDLGDEHGEGLRGEPGSVSESESSSTKPGVYSVSRGRRGVFPNCSDMILSWYRWTVVGYGSTVALSNHLCSEAPCVGR